MRNIGLNNNTAIESTCLLRNVTKIKYLKNNQKEEGAKRERRIEAGK